MIENLLLSDEIEIDEVNYNERRKLMEELSEFPKEIFSKLRHFQPQIGCLNACRFCSKNSGNVTEFWNEKRIRNVIASIKFSVINFRKDYPIIAWDRKEHRPGVIFPYLDNDIGNYYYLDKFIFLLYQELGVQTRISTVGYSRFNEKLNEMHRRINSDEFIEKIGGVRLSFAPYGKGWESSEKELYSREEYIEDMANFLKIYRYYYDKAGQGYRKMCVELRYSPLVINSNVLIIERYGHKIISANNYMYISEDVNIDMKISEISNPYDNLITLTENPCFFYEINTQKQIQDIDELKNKIDIYFNSNFKGCNRCEVYLLKNHEGEYYSINPKLCNRGNYGINIYPKTKQRKKSGYIVTERFLLNAIFQYKSERNISSFGEFKNATWDDVDCIVNICIKNANEYKKSNKVDKAEYIEEVILPMIKGYIIALKKAEYSAEDFFNPNFTIDTGMICNLGRAINEFKGLCQKVNEPLTPNHERNYGKKNSLMTKEGTVWRLSCGYNNNIIIEKLNLYDTASIKGQIEFRKTIQLGFMNEKLIDDDLKTSYLIPGQRSIKNGNLFL